MTRRQLRTHVFKLLYRTFFYTAEEMEGQLALFFEDAGPEMEEQDQEYIRNRLRSIMKLLPEIDGAIDEKSESWKVNRMNYVDLSIIRLAYYEIYHDEDIPMAVAINEAVEIAKIYGGEDSSSFVNGILAKLL